AEADRCVGSSLFASIPLLALKDIYPEAAPSPRAAKSAAGSRANVQHVASTGCLARTRGLVDATLTLSTSEIAAERRPARKRRFQLLRDLKGLEKGIGRKLSNAELMQVFDEWHRLSQPFLRSAKTRDDYLAAFLAELGKVRVATGDGDTVNKAV